MGKFKIKKSRGGEKSTVVTGSMKAPFWKRKTKQPTEPQASSITPPKEDETFMGQIEHKRMDVHKVSNLFQHYKRFIIVAGLVLVVGLGYYFIFWNPVKAPPHVDLSSIPSDYNEMTSEQMNSLLYQKSGLTIDYLKKNDIKSKTFKNFDAAYTAAQVLSQLGLKEKALKAYEFAEVKKTAEVDYRFHLSYADEALSANPSNLELWKAQVLKAKEVLLADPTRSEVSKKEEAANLDMQIRLVEIEAQSGVEQE